jgi:hypothetical protein
MLWAEYGQGGDREITGDNIKVVRAEFSTLSWTVFLMNL